LKQYEVIADFIDKNTKVYYQIGTDYPASSTKRTNELMKNGFIREVEVPGDENESSKSE
jgi:hypothetical protein